MEDEVKLNDALGDEENEAAKIDDENMTEEAKEVLEPVEEIETLADTASVEESQPETGEMEDASTEAADVEETSSETAEVDDSDVATEEDEQADKVFLDEQAESASEKEVVEDVKEPAEEAEIADVAEESTESFGGDGDGKTNEKFFAKIGRWIKSHLWVVILAGVLVLSAVGVTIGHFATTWRTAFVKDAEGLTATLADSERYNKIVIKKDIVIDGDVVFGKAYSFDMKNNKLTINGEAKFDLGASDQTVVVCSYQKKQKGPGGEIEAKSFVFSGAAASVELYSKISSENVNITANNLYMSELAADTTAINANAIKLVGNVSAKTEGAAAKLDLGSAASTAEAELAGKVAADIKLGAAINLTLKDNASANAIDGGNNVLVSNGATVSIIENVLGVLTVRESANVATMQNNAAVILCEKLETPFSVTIVTDNGKLIATLTEVPNAVEYAYQLNDGEVRKSTTSTFEILDKPVPGENKLYVWACGNYGVDGVVGTAVRYVDSEKQNVVFNYTVKLAAPVVTVTEGVLDAVGKYYVVINNVNNADYFELYINDVKIADVEASSIDIGKSSYEITDKIAALGSYSIKVVAKSNQTHYLQSDTTQITYMKEAAFAAITITEENIVEEDGKATIIWQALDGARYYKVVVRIDGENYYTAYTTATSITIDAPEGGLIANATKEILVVAEPNGYYN